MVVVLRLRPGPLSQRPRSLRSNLKADHQINPLSLSSPQRFNLSKQYRANKIMYSQAPWVRVDHLGHLPQMLVVSLISNLLQHNLHTQTLHIIQPQMPIKLLPHSNRTLTQQIPPPLINLPLKINPRPVPRLPLRANLSSPCNPRLSSS